MGRATPARKVARLDWTIVFCIFVLGFAPFYSVYWYLIPCAVSLILQTQWVVGLTMSLACLALTYLSPLLFGTSMTSLDALGTLHFYLMGFCLWQLRKAKQSFLPYIFWALALSTLAVLLLILSVWLDSKDFSFRQWAESQLNSQIFPYFFHRRVYPVEQVYIFDSFFKPFLISGMVGWYSALIASAFFVNGLMENLLKSFRAANLRGQARVFDRFNRWRSTEWVLIPLVGALICLALDYGAYQGTQFPLQLIGWNLAVLSAFPLFVQGMALVSYLIPRLNFLFVILVLLVIFFNPIPVLVLAGLGDVWFDLRAKIETNIQKDEDNTI